MPNNPRGGGVSRRIEGEERNELRDIIDQLEIPHGMSVIGRTAAIGRTREELEWDLNYLVLLWRAIEQAAHQQTGAFLIYQESSLVIRAIRDYFHQDIGEILIDTETIYEQAQQFMGHVMPDNVNRVKLYKDDVPLFSRFQIEHQIESAYSRSVSLPSGGGIVIDHTEALVSIDVNSARSTRGADIEETAFRTNLEAADELARQLRLRDLGGLIVIDFIDMESTRNQREVENRLRDALKYDRARVQMGKISRFGLLELSRQRLRPSLGETSHSACPRCHGTGHIRGTESTALHILRIIQEEAMKDNTAAVQAQVPVDVATFLLNEKRVDLQLVEARHRVSVTLIPNMHLETPNYSVSRMRHDDLNNAEPLPPSYELVEAPTEEKTITETGQEAAAARPLAAVRGITPQQPAPVAREQPPVAAAAVPPPAADDHSIMGKIFGWFRRKSEEPIAPPPAEPEQAPSARPTPRPRREMPRPRSEDRDGSREGGRRERHGGQARSRTESASAGGERRERDSGRRRGGGEQQRGERRPERVRGDNAQHGRQHQQHVRGEAQPQPQPPAQVARLTGESVEPQAREQQAAQQGQAADREHREHGEGRGRRRRGRRGERHEQRAEAAPETRNVATPADENAVAPVDAALTTSAPHFSAPEPVALSTEPEPVALSTEPEPVAHYAAQTPSPASVPEPEPERPVELSVLEHTPPPTPQHVRSGATPESVLATLKAEWPAELVQVETDPGKVQPIQELEDLLGSRAGRTRPALLPVSDEPLIQVETRRREVPPEDIQRTPESSAV
jgi:ribonuclease E